VLAGQDRHALVDRSYCGAMWVVEASVLSDGTLLKRRGDAQAPRHPLLSFTQKLLGGVCSMQAYQVPGDGVEDLCLVGIQLQGLLVVGNGERRLVSSLVELCQSDEQLKCVVQR